MPENTSQTCSTDSLIQSSITNEAYNSSSEQIPPTMKTADSSEDAGAASPLTNMKLTMLGRAQSTPPEFTSDRLLQSRRRGKSAGFSDLRTSEDSKCVVNLFKQKSQYFEKEFASREPQATARERVAKDSIISLDIKFNSCLDDAGNIFYGDLSFALSEIYQRPPSCIMVVMTTGASILLHGTTEPAYHLTLTALPPDIAATKNKRSAHLIQKFMHDSLGILPSRGVIKFETIAEDNLATNGSTALQEIEALEKGLLEDNRFDITDRQKGRKVKTSTAVVMDEVSKPAGLTQRMLKPQLFRKSSRIMAEEILPEIATQTPVGTTRRKRLMSLFGI